MPSGSCAASPGASVFSFRIGAVQLHGWSLCRLPRPPPRPTTSSFRSGAGLSQAPEERLRTVKSIKFFMGTVDVFMDTAGFLALWDAADQHHDAAVKLQADLARKRRRFLTTDYVVDETVTLLLVRHSHSAASDFLETVESTDSLQLEWTSSDIFYEAARIFCGHADKKWSFTDCVSFAVMRVSRIQDSFTTDHHFQQAGFNPLLKRQGSARA